LWTSPTHPHIHTCTHAPSSLAKASLQNLYRISTCAAGLTVYQVEQLTEETQRLDAISKALQAQQAVAQNKNSSELLTIVERKLNARQNRMEDALMQVSNNVF
jgi:hypothetical protein